MICYALRVRTLLVVSVLALAIGCKGKPKHQDPPASVELPAGSGSSSPKPAADLVLPQGPGTPPSKTTKALGTDTFNKLKELKYPGFFAEMKWNDEKGFEVRQKTEDHPKLWATITIQPCGDCTPMELAKWEHKDSLKELLMPELRNRPEVDFTVGTTDLHGAPMIWTHQLGYYMGAEGGGFTNAYILYYNDGVNQIRVVSEYKDDPATKENLLKLAPKEDLEKIAKAFMDAYTHAW